MAFNWDWYTLTLRLVRRSLNKGSVQKGRAGSEKLLQHIQVSARPSRWRPISLGASHLARHSSSSKGTPGRTLKLPLNYLCRDMLQAEALHSLEISHHCWACADNLLRGHQAYVQHFVKSFRLPLCDVLGPPGYKSRASYSPDSERWRCLNSSRDSHHHFNKS